MKTDQIVRLLKMLHTFQYSRSDEMFADPDKHLFAYLKDPTEIRSLWEIGRTGSCRAQANSAISALLLEEAVARSADPEIRAIWAQVQMPKLEELFNRAIKGAVSALLLPDQRLEILKLALTYLTAAEAWATSLGIPVDVNGHSVGM